MIVTNTAGTSAARSASSDSSAPRSMFPLKGCSFAGSRPSGITRSTRLGAGELDVRARRVEVRVVRDHLAGPADRAEQDLLGGAPLVRGDHVREREERLHRLEEPVPGGRARVALVAVLDRGPLVARHRARPGVGEQVDQDVVGVQVEQVVAGGADRGLALLAGGDPQRLDRVDPERLDDRVELGRGHGARVPRETVCPGRANAHEGASFRGSARLGSAHGTRSR